MACGGDPAPLPPLADADASTLSAAIRGAPPEKTSFTACKALAEIERDRLPTFLTASLADYSNVAADQRAMTIAKNIDSSDGRSAWKAACPGGLAVLEELAMLAAEDRTELLWTKCEMSRFALFDAETVKAADAVGILLALLTADHLTRAKSLGEDEAFAISQIIATPRAVIEADLEFDEDTPPPPEMIP